MPTSFTAVALLLTTLIAASPTVGSERGTSTITRFGHVRVSIENVRTAMDEGEAAYLSAKGVLGIRSARFTIVDADYTSRKWGDLSSDGAPIYVWQFRRSSGDHVQPAPAYLLRHEIGHDLFIRYLVPSTKRDQYGGDAPDWLDEMAAVAFEGEALRAIRRREAVRYLREKRLIPLHRFLSMTHPEMAAKSIPVSSGGLATAFEAASDDTPLFYAMASAFYDFLISRTRNPAIVAELANAVRKGEPLEQYIINRTRQRGGIPALEADFSNWIASDIRYGGYSHPTPNRS